MDPDWRETGLNYRVTDTQETLVISSGQSRTFTTRTNTYHFLPLFLLPAESANLVTNYFKLSAKRCKFIIDY